MKSFSISASSGLVIGITRDLSTQLYTWDDGTPYLDGTTGAGFVWDSGAATASRVDSNYKINDMGATYNNFKVLCQGYPDDPSLW